MRLGPVCNGMGAGHGTGGLVDSMMFHTQLLGGPMCTTVWILCCHIQYNMFKFWCLASVQLTSVH
jgi:hypothetical protein